MPLDTVPLRLQYRVRIAILHNAVSPDAPPEDQDTLVQVEAVASALVRLGHEVTRLPCTLDLASLHEQLSQQRPELVFSLVESLAESDSLAYLPSALLDAIGVRYVGNRTEALFLTAHKILGKERLRLAGLPTPDWIILECGDSSPLSDERAAILGKPLRSRQCELPRPKAAASGRTPNSAWILKGLWDQGSRGMGDDAVMKDVSEEEVRARLAEWMAKTGRPCFAEQFIEGREFNVAMLAGATSPTTLPPAEIKFTAFPDGKPRIVGHRAKWDTESFEYSNTPRTFDFPQADQPLLDRLAELARQCWNLFRLRGWVRVDFRVDAAGEPWILEVNANPCLSPDAGFAAALERASIPYDEAIRRIVENAFA